MWRTGCAFLATFLFAGAAHADEHTTFGGSLLLGADQHVGYDTQTKFAIGFRPEVLFHLDQAAAGVYGEAVHAGDDWLGGGLTAGYFPIPFVAVLASGGIDRRVHADDNGRLTSVFGLFGGIRNMGKSGDGGPFSMAAGLRFDVRPGAHDIPTSLSLTVQLDVVGWVALFVRVAIDPSYGH